MNTRTKQRIRNSISFRVAVAGIVLFLAGAGIDIVAVPLLSGGREFGVWSGITALVGAYMTLLALTMLGILEFLRFTGY